MARRTRQPLNISRGIPDRKCVDCGYEIGQVMYDRCRSCEPWITRTSYVAPQIDLTRYLVAPKRPMASA